MTSGARGFALVAVLLVLGLLGIIGAEFAYSMRLEASAMRAWRDGINAAHLAEAGLEQALRELSGDVAFMSEAMDGLLTFYNPQRMAIPRLARFRVRLGPGEFSYRVTDEQSRISVNTNQRQLERLLLCLGIDKNLRDQIIDSILDWTDTNEEHRLHGAESDDYYLTLPTPYRARNGPIESVSELLQIKGVTPALFGGVDGKPGLADVLTAARTAGQVNVNTAGPVVLCGMGASEAQISSIIQGRRETPFGTVTEAASTLQGMTTTSQTFRIEAEGLIDGRPRASLTAIVQRPTRLTAQATIRVVEWSGVR